MTGNYEKESKFERGSGARALETCFVDLLLYSNLFAQPTQMARGINGKKIEMFLMGGG